METTILEQIGLTESEAKVYLAMLKLGESTAGPIVEEAKVTRSKIYDIIERLKNKGLVSYITKESTKYFSASDPSNIINHIEDKKKELEKKKQSVEKLLPELEMQYRSAITNKTAEVFIGIKGMKNAFNTLIGEFDPKEHYYVFGAGKGEDVEIFQMFFSQLHEARKEAKVRSSIIFNETSRGLFISQEKSKLVEVRYLMESTPASINIYKEFTIIAILAKNPITFLIRNKEVAESFKEYFKVMWKIAKK